MSQWQALYKSEDWLGCWIGLGIIAAAIIYFSLTTLSFKAPAFRWTTGAEFQGHIAAMAPVVDRLVQQAGDKGEAALQEAGLALQAAIAAKDRKAVGAASKKLEGAAKDTKDKGLKKKAEDVGKDLGSQAGGLPDKVMSSDNLKYSLYILIAYLFIGIIGMALMGIVYSFNQNIPFAIVIVMISGFFNAPSAIARRLVVQRNTPREMRGRVNSVFFVSRDIFFLIGMGAAGFAGFIDPARSTKLRTLRRLPGDCSVSSCSVTNR